MSIGFFPFVLIPLLIYTYFWMNPTALAVFLEGVAKSVVEIYLGYKAWKLEWQTKKAFRYYRRQSKKLAEANGFSETLVKAYFKTYGKDDWKAIYDQQKRDYEEKNRNLEDEMRDLLAF